MRRETPIGFVVFAAAILAGTAVRAVTMGGELWLDEIWSLTLVSSLASPLQIFAGLGTDNNHPLCSFMLYALGPDRPIWQYRIVPAFASVATLILLPRLGRALGQRDGPFPTILCAMSFLIAVYGSEARGYAFALFFQVAALITWAEKSGREWWRSSLAYAVFIGVAMLSHFSAFLLAAALLAVDGIRSLRAPASFPGRLRFQIPAVAVAGAVYLVMVRDLPPGTGTLVSRLDVFGNLGALLGGGPLLSAYDLEAGMRGLLVAAVAYALVAVELSLMGRERGRGLDVFVVTQLLIPGVVLFVLQPHVLYERYFLFQALLAFLLLGNFIQRMWEQGAVGRGTALAAIAFFVHGNLNLLVRFREVGRGNASDVMRRLEASPGESVGSNQDFRLRMVLDFHARRRGFEPMAVVPGSWDEPGATIGDPQITWFVLQNQDYRFVPPAAIASNGQSFLLEAAAPFAGLSGSGWYLYRRTRA